MAWQDPYLDPATGLLRNLLGITDANQLAQVEATYTRRRTAQLRRRPIPGAFDLAHLQTVHRHITQDLVVWAGELRTVDISKGNAFCLVSNLHSYADEVFGRLAHDQWLRGRDRTSFVDGLTTLYADVNALHLYRSK
ncbi:MAG: Fic/DOC family protein [Acidimicrobiales bacterium]